MSTQGDKLKAIADAIRAKEGSSDPIVANDFPARIAAIETGTQLPTLTNPGTAADMASGKQLIGQDGEIVTGTISELNSNNSVDLENGNIPYLNGTDIVTRATWPQNYERIVRGTPWIYLKTNVSNFGNATAADVAAGKTFTSAAGVKVAGTAASMPAMATVTVNIGSTGWTNTDIFAPFDYLSIGGLPFDPSAARVSSPATFQVPVGGAFGIAAGAGGVKPTSITGGRVIIDSEGTDGNHYSMIVVESASCYITMGLT